MTNIFQQSAISRHILCCALVLLGVLPLALKAADTTVSQAVDVNTLRHIPVFHKGRIQPFDTFANIIMAEVCERPKKRNVTLSLKTYYDRDQLAEPRYAPALKLFPGGNSRKWDSTELVFSWLVEQEKWEDVPFLYAPHPSLRKLLGVPIQHMKFKYVSPRQVLESDGLQEHFQSLRDRQSEARQAGKKFVPSLLDEHVQKLIDRYHVYRTISFDARKPLTFGPLMTAGSRATFVMQAERVARLLQNPSADGRDLHSTLQLFTQSPGEGKVKLSCQATLQSVAGVFQIADSLRRRMEAIAMGGADIDDVDGSVSLADAAQSVNLFVLATQDLDSHFQDQHHDLTSRFGDVPVEQQERLNKIFREMVSKTKELKRLAKETQLSLYYSSHQNQSPPHKSFRSPMVIPALNAAALDKNRDVRNSSQPWLSLQTVMYADDVMKSYPQSVLEEVRSAWNAMAASYQDRTSKSRGKDFLAAQEDLATSLRSLGKSLEKQRLELVKQELEPHQRDNDLIAYTQYPVDDKAIRRLNTEVQYNHINPFRWSFAFCLMALMLFSLAFGKPRKVMFWTGVATCLVTLLWTAYGFYLRVTITGWAPVTNMYETVVWVPFVTLSLATWFLLWPLTRSGMGDAWRLNAIPYSWEAVPLTEAQEKQMSPQRWEAFGFLCGMLRLGLMAGLFYFLTQMPLGDGGRTYFSLSPDLGAVQGSWLGVANKLGVWFVGLVCVLMAIWFLPRLGLGFLASLVLIPLHWRTTDQMVKMTTDVFNRKPFVLAGTGLAAFCFLLACYAPNDALDENISALQPVLRTNFWLTIHVLTIVSSYAAGALGMGLGNVALFYYLFGKYRKPAAAAETTSEDASDEKTPSQKLKSRPPEQCAALAGYAYKAIQVAVLLLAAGTILGGLWADVSWGRFWGWDPKEVWALISLLVYLAILHGRYAGWFSNFGLIFGTVLGATMIVMSWYGVNFVLPMLSTSGEVGLHSYGSGAGGLEYVAGFVLANWLFLAAATTRYTISSNTS